jgi:hypothetical protein
LLVDIKLCMQIQTRSGTLETRGMESIPIDEVPVQNSIPNPERSLLSSISQGLPCSMESWGCSNRGIGTCQCMDKDTNQLSATPTYSYIILRKRKA